MARGCRVAVLLSGSGTTLQNFLDCSERGELPGVSFDLVLSSKADAYGLTRAREHGIPTAVVESKKFRDPATKQTDWGSMSQDISRHILEAKVDLVVFAGFMCLYVVPPELDGKVMNVHPALIPAFSGQGMYGDKVHKAVVARGVKLTGCTVHFVTNEYDAGPIIVQSTTPVTSSDTWEDVQGRVQALERSSYPEAVRLFAAGRLRIEEGKVHVSS